MTDRRPCAEQEDRDRLADPSMPDPDYRIGTGDQAQHHEELMPS